MEQSEWENIVLDAAAVPLPLSEERFARWLATRRVFVSSTMDAEMTPYRDAVRTYLQKYAVGAAVMWETLSPQDLGPKNAFLAGVNQSNVFLLLLGSRYGVPDDSGYSPTHQEANRAKDRHLPRLVFTLPISNAARDGKLNDWIRELHVDVSGHSVASPEAVVRSLDVRLRDLAARSERLWLKLGDCIFTGIVEPEADQQGRRKFTVTARAYSNEIRQALMATTDSGRRSSGEMRLTWANDSHIVQVMTVKQKQEFIGEADIEIVCQTPANQYGSGSTINAMVVNGESPGDQTSRWLSQAVFGEAAPTMSSLTAIFSRPEHPNLPQILATVGASGWQAEGIVRLYAVEQLARRRGGRFIELHVERTTASGVPLNGRFVLEQYGRPSNPVDVNGIVPLPG